MTIKQLVKSANSSLKDFRKKRKRIRKLNSIYKWERFIGLYVDRRSVELIKARVQLLQDNNYATFSDCIIGVEGGQYHLLTDAIYLNSKIVIVGDDEMCRYTINTIRNSDYPGEALLIGKDLNKLKAIGSGGSCIVTTISEEESIELRTEIQTVYSNWKVIDLDNRMLIGILGNQYFDVFDAKEHEIVVDGGAYDGTTEKGFYEWGGGKIDKIYAFEMDPHNAKSCREFYRINKYDNVVLINKGTGKKKQKVCLREESVGSAGSKIGEGTLKAEITRIDDEVGNDAVTFIKLDVEGAELATLKGARKTIKNNKPRLAISIYHKPEDLYEIPGYLHKLVPEYRFVVRQYTSMIWEAILYAYVP